MTQPRLAFLIPNFAGGGAEAMIIRLANEFARRGREVDLVVFRPEGENALGMACGGSAEVWFDYVPPLVSALRERGISPWGWHYVRGDDPSG